MDVGKMNFGDGQWRDGADGVVNGDRGVAVGARIDDDADSLVGGFLYPVDEVALMVRLTEIDLEPKCRTCLLAIVCDRGKRLAAIDARLALAERVEVGTVQDENRFQNADLSQCDFESEIRDTLEQRFERI